MEQRIRSAWDTVIKDVSDELDHQYNKWGSQYHNIHVHNSISGEEYGEMIQAINDADFISSSDPIKIKDAWQLVMDEAVDTIACLVQLGEEARMRRDGESNTALHRGVNHVSTH